ncbi:tryptophan-rich sensory protein [Niallia sp. 03133]|uniref:tryptophan-rich sensory protein n=1 Tax=Niallia sp. 03133 TaxID=3458060 RepID=UPI00404487BF
MKRFFLHLIAFFIMIGINALANIIPLNGQTTDEISNKVIVLITPAPYAFMIWGLIYTAVAIWLVREIQITKRNSSVYTQTSFLFILSCLLNACWIIVWHYEYMALSVVTMILLLITLILLYKKIKFYSSSFSAYFPFSIYLGWISVASILNISYYVKYKEWDVFSLSDTTWTVTLLGVASGVGILFRIKEKDWLYPLVLIWAFIAIGVKNSVSFPSISYCCYALAAVLFIFNFYPQSRKKRYKYY